MRAFLTGITASRIAALALAALTTLTFANAASAQAIPAIPDPKPLTPTQEAVRIRDEIPGWWGCSSTAARRRRSKLAANAVGICLGAAYGYGLTHDQAEAACGEVLDAYIVQAGHDPLRPDA